MEIDEPGARYRVYGYDSGRGEKTASARPLPTERELERDVKTSRGRKYRKLAVALACIVLFCIGAVIIAKIWIRPPEVKEGGLTARETPAAEPTPALTAKPAPNPTPTPEDTLRKPGTYTFLALGKDDAGLNTDTIMVGKLDTKNGTLDIVSIPRDTLVNVRWANKKINAIYANAGDGTQGSIEGMMEGVGAILGFPLDNYVLINIKAFEEMVDTVGGVYYDVPRDMYYDDPTQNLHIAIPKGYQLLDGEHALYVVRFRCGNNNSGYVDGDLGRIATQQDFLLSVARQMLTLGNIPNLPKLIQIMMENVETDLTGNNLAFYAQEFLKLDAENIRFHTLPADGVSIRGGSYMSIRVGEWLQMVNDYLNPFKQEVTEAHVDILTTANGRTFSSTTGVVPSLDSFFQYPGG